MKIAIDIKSGEIVKDTTHDKKIVIGIDLGTTNSLVAYIEGENPVTIKQEGLASLVPSIIYFDPSGVASVGNQAKAMLVKEPERTIYSVKRLLGKSYKDLIEKNIILGYNVIDNDDANSLVKIEVDGRYYSPIQLSSMILQSLKTMAEQALGREVTQAVITVPAYFNDAQRQATRDAGRLAGLEVLRIINEPTAASLAYGIGTNRDDHKIVAVYDLGGGTFDVSILQIEEGVFEVMSTHGDTFLGGDDVDQLIANHWRSKYDLRLTSKALEQELRLLSERAKKELSKLDQVALKFGDQDLYLDTATFNTLINPLVSSTLESFDKAIKDAKIKVEDLHSIILVGGSTRIPLIKASLQQKYQRPIDDSLNPDDVVALGAAVQGDILAGNRKDMLLLDITPLSLGIETLGGLMDVIIPRNTKIPTKAGRQYTTSKDGQRNLAVTVFQGERDLVQHNRKLGSFVLKDLPPMAAGLPKIDIQFILDADGVLIVKASELRSGTTTQVEIKSSYRITEEEMSLMLIDSIKNASKDMEIKAVLEATNEANSILLATTKFIESNKGLFTEQQMQELEAKKVALLTSLETKNKDEINLAIENLNAYANPLAEISMDHAIKESIKGSKIN